MTNKAISEIVRIIKEYTTCDFCKHNKLTGGCDECCGFELDEPELIEFLKEE